MKEYEGLTFEEAVEKQNKEYLGCNNMNLEKCGLCKKDSMPWFYVNGHICQDCYENVKCKWIGVKDTLPNENQNVLTYSGNNFYSTALFCYHNFTKEPMFILMPSCENVHDDKLVAYLKNVIYWMPLPESPDGIL